MRTRKVSAYELTEMILAKIEHLTTEHLAEIASDVLDVNVDDIGDGDFEIHE
jgi:hypothetical protein